MLSKPKAYIISIGALLILCFYYVVMQFENYSRNWDMFMMALVIITAFSCVRIFKINMFSVAAHLTLGVLIGIILSLVNDYSFTTNTHNLFGLEIIIYCFITMIFSLIGGFLAYLSTLLVKP